MILSLVLMLSSGTFAQSRDVLYYVDGLHSTDRMAQALSPLGTGYTSTFTDSASTFQTVLNTGNFELGIFVVQSEPASIYASAINALGSHVAAGGRAIYCDWSRNAGLAAQFGAGFTGNTNQSGMSVSDSALQQGLSSSTQSFSNPSWLTYNVGLTGSSVSATYGNGQAAIIKGNSGRSIVNGFLSDTFANGSDGVTLYRNEVRGLFELNWNNAAGGNWHNSSNWDKSVVPTSVDDAIFKLNSSYIVTLATDAITRKFNVTNDGVDLNLSGKRLTTGHLSDSAMNIGANGRLFLSNGTFQTTLGGTPGPGADIQIDGGGKLTITSGTLLVGGAMAVGANGAGTGSMIFDGGTTNIGTEAGTDHTLFVGVNTAAVVSQFAGTVSVASSARIGNTNTGAGTYTMTGGLLNVGADLRIGGPTSNGTMSISGPAAVTVTNATTVLSTGALIISGGSLTTHDLNLGSAGSFAFSNGTVTVNGGAMTPKLFPGNQWRVGGLTGTPLLRLIGGATLNASASALFIGDGGAKGSIGVDGGGSSITVNSIELGDDVGGQGTLSLSNGAKLSVSGTLKVRNSSSLVSLAGGTLSTGTLDTQSTPARFTWSGGTLEITNSNLSIGTGGPLGTSVALSGGKALRISGASQYLRVPASGTIDFGTGTVDLTSKDAIFDATPLATVAAKITLAYNGGSWNGAGLTSSSAQAIAADAGNLHKTALGYATASSINATLFDGQSVSGATVLVRYTYSGDANIDGVVNALDFNALASNFGGVTGKFWVEGDFNYDGFTNTLDFNSIAGNFNAALPSPPALMTMVPEPGHLIGLAFLAGLKRGRRLRIGN